MAIYLMVRRKEKLDRKCIRTKEMNKPKNDLSILKEQKRQVIVRNIPDTPNARSPMLFDKFKM